MNAMQLSEAVRFLDNLLFWVQCPDPNGHTTQDSWRNAMLERMEELLVDHVSYRSISPKVRKLIHTLNGNPFPEFLKEPFVEVEKIRDELRNELNQVDSPTPKRQMETEEYYILTDRWKQFYQDFDLHRSVYEALEIWFTLVNQDANQDIVNLMVKLTAIDHQVRMEYNKLPEIDKAKADAMEIGPLCLPAIETIINVCHNVSHWTNIYGTTRKEITDKLNELGLPSKPVEVDLLQRSWVKLKDQLQKPQEIDIIAHVDVLFSECKGSHNVRGEAMEGKLTSDEYEAYKQAKQANGGKPITQTIKKHFAERSKGEARKSK